MVALMEPIKSWPQYSLNIETSSTTKYRYCSPFLYLLVCIKKVLLIFKKIVFCPRFSNINQMIWHLTTINCIVC